MSLRVLPGLVRPAAARPRGRPARGEGARLRPMVLHEASPEGDRPVPAGGDADQAEGAGPGAAGRGPGAGAAADEGRGAPAFASAEPADEPPAPPPPAPPATPLAAPAFDRRMLEFLVCPVTHAALTYDPVRRELISRAVHLAFPIRNGIPILLASEAREVD